VSVEEGPLPFKKDFPTADVKTPSQPIEATIYRDCWTLICPLYLAVPSRCLAWKHLSITRSLVLLWSMQMSVRKPLLNPLLQPHLNWVKVKGSEFWVLQRGSFSCEKGPHRSVYLLNAIAFLHSPPPLSYQNIPHCFIDTKLLLFLLPRWLFFYDSCLRCPGSYLIGYFISALQMQFKQRRPLVHFHCILDIWYFILFRFFVFRLLL